MHRHKWVDESTDYHPPQKVLSVWGWDEWAGLAARLMEGWTILQQRCAKCRAVRSTELRGKFEIPSPPLTPYQEFVREVD